MTSHFGTLFYLYNTLQYDHDVDNNVFFFLVFCFLEMEKIKPVYAPKDFFEVHKIIAETTYEQRTGFTQS